jgi:diphosphomevalonate decarboxylase
MTVVARTSPSLALVKYWGKLPSGTNLAATSNLAVTLGALHTETRVEATSDEDLVLVDGTAQPLERFAPVIDLVRSRAADPRPVRVESANSFPTAAGLASSSSGLAALVLALDGFFGTHLPAEELSAIARLGSGSACRAVFGGFTTWLAGSDSASEFLPADHWPELRILVVVLQEGAKSISSRAAMERARLTSPYYQAWVHSSAGVFEQACAALTARDVERLGRTMRASYLSMFGTMFTSDPPVVYWRPESVAVIRACEALRAGGTPVWETMDAGPQVKLLTLAEHADPVSRAVVEAVPGARIIVSGVGGAPVVEEAPTRDAPHD